MKFLRYVHFKVRNQIVRPPKRKRTLPPRLDQMKSLQSGEEYDVLIIGGGATGAGCALDAVTRGLKTALVEADDFASGTSSRSTKLIHGGVRYLQKAILGVRIHQIQNIYLLKYIRFKNFTESYKRYIGTQMCDCIPM